MGANRRLMTLVLLPVSILVLGGGAASERTKPQWLSETGLFDATGRIAPENLSYSPQYPLWTDGAEKSRWIHIPPDAKIDVSDVDSWQFPVGTKLWKEFRFGGRKVETRLIWRAGPDEWTFATYRWNDEQTDALLVPEEGIPDYLAIAPGKKHSLPGVLDCKICHENGRTPVLGFTALQLSTDRDPLALHAEPIEADMLTLPKLMEKGLLVPAREELVRMPPKIQSSNPRTRAALGYLSTNCGICHNSLGPLASLGLDLEHYSTATSEETEAGIATTVGAKGRYTIPGNEPETSLRIDAGEPDKSTIFYRMRSRRPSSQMPPLGSTLVDDEAVDLIRRWIAEDLTRTRKR